MIKSVGALWSYKGIEDKEFFQFYGTQGMLKFIKFFYITVFWENSVL